MRQPAFRYDTAKFETQAGASDFGATARSAATGFCECRHTHDEGRFVIGAQLGRQLFGLDATEFCFEEGDRFSKRAKPLFFGDHHSFDDYRMTGPNAKISTLFRFAVHLTVRVPGKRLAQRAVKCSRL